MVQLRFTKVEATMGLHCNELSGHDVGSACDLLKTRQSKLLVLCVWACVDLTGKGCLPGKRVRSRQLQVWMRAPGVSYLYLMLEIL